MARPIQSGNTKVATLLPQHAQGGLSQAALNLTKTDLISILNAQPTPAAAAISIGELEALGGVFIRPPTGMQPLDVNCCCCAPCCCCSAAASIGNRQPG